MSDMVYGPPPFEPRCLFCQSLLCDGMHECDGLRKLREEAAGINELMMLREDPRDAEIAKLRAERDAALDRMRRFKGWRCVIEYKDGSEPCRKPFETLANALDDARFYRRCNDVARSYAVRVFAKRREAKR